jgi:transcriptional regulator with XRE-family HTH domain
MLNVDAVLKPLGALRVTEADLLEEVSRRLRVAPKMNSKVTGAFLKRARQKSGKTQLDVAQAMGVMVQQVGRFESGKVEPMLSTIAGFAKALGAPSSSRSSRTGCRVANAERSSQPYPSVAASGARWPSPSRPLRFLLFGSFQPLHIEQVLITGSSALVDHEMLSGEHRCFLVSEAGRYALGPGVGKLHAVDRGDHVDPDRLDADLKDQAGCGEIGGGEVMQGSAEVPQRVEDALRIIDVGSNPDGEILGGTNESMCRERVRTYDEELNATSVECG